MPKKSFQDDVIGEYTVTKKKNARRITLSISRLGVPNVTIPTLLPYSSGNMFLREHRKWVLQRSATPFAINPPQTVELYDGSRIQFESSNGRNSASKSGQILKCSIVAGEPGQKYAKKYIHGFLASDTKNAVLPRIEKYADALDAMPSQVRFRSTTSRWGSCTSKKVLTFSVYLAQLPNELIDYIVIHELAHIQHMNHSPNFWKLVEVHDPSFKEHRRELKKHKLEPIIKKV